MTISTQEVEDVMRTNYFGLFHVTQAVLPNIRAKGKGMLCYVSCQAGWHGDASTMGYCSTKFALEIPQRQLIIDKSTIVFYVRPQNSENSGSRPLSHR
ncbi:hypothetical protein F4821DRAFT_32138 [Hypoxylon rubiginosum]|uniref:Uncharacterized protein n=1 Tax=Hypoxylon rubiginosum TaxID=110542 RepID=A0ACC0CLN4_9PEZI|nr:hypothetical protein F4821DRAFT_32138 [Hypoxylon rubiginosum]